MPRSKSGLHVVTAEDISDAVKAMAEPTKPKTITEAAEAGDQRELLVAMRRRVAATVQDPACPPRDLAALTRRLQEIGREIEALDAKAKQEAAEDGDTGTPDEDWDSEAI